MDKETKTGVQLKEMDEAGTGVARIATLDVIDHDGDIVVKGAFGEQNVLVLPSHQWGNIPLGRARVFEKGREVLAEFQLNLDTAQGTEWHKALLFDFKRGDPLQQWSYGFIVEKASFREEEGVGRVRILEQIEVHEVSPVVLGAGIGTGTLAVKGKQTFEKQLDAVMTEIDDIVKRAVSIVKLRADEGRKLSPARLEQIGELKNRLEKLIASCKEVDPAEANKLLAQFTAIQTGRHKGE